jgi:hypothetical protein
MFTQWKLAAVVVVGLAASAIVGYRTAATRSDQAFPTETKPTEKQTLATEREADDRDLRNQLARLEARVAVLAASPAVSASAGTRSEPAKKTARPPSAEELEEDARKWHTHMADVHAKFKAEPRTSTWANSAKGALIENLGVDQALGSAVRNIECRSTMCRVELLDNRSAEFSKKLPEFLSRVGTALPMAEADFVENPDGTRTASIYLSSTVDAGDS